MTRDEIQVVVRTMLAMSRLIARRTRTQADDLMVAILEANETRLADAIVLVEQKSAQPPSDEEILRALKQVGIDVG